MLDRTHPSKRRRAGIGATVAIGALALALAAVALRQGGAATPTPSPSPAAAGGGAPSASTGSATPAGPAPAAVFGYLPYWEMNAGTVDYLATTSLSTLAMFSVGPTADLSSIGHDNGYRAITSDRGAAIIAAAKARGVRVELVFSSFVASRNRTLFGLVVDGSTAGPDAVRQHMAAALVALAMSVGADGVNVDVENFDGTQLPGYAAFIGDIRTQLDAAGPGRSLSVATTAGPLGAAMAAAAIGAGADRDFLMGYDFHYPGSQPGASSPLQAGDRPERTLTTALARYAAVGIPMDQVIIGLPLYGNSWPIDPASRKVLRRSGAGATWIPANHVADRALVEAGQFLDPVAAVEIFDEILPDGSRRRLFYDSPRSLEEKVRWALSSGSAGVGFWALGYDQGWPGYWEMVRSLITPRA